MFSQSFNRNLMFFCNLPKIIPRLNRVGLLVFNLRLYSFYNIGFCARYMRKKCLKDKRVVIRLWNRQAMECVELSAHFLQIASDLALQSRSCSKREKEGFGSGKRSRNSKRSKSSNLLATNSRSHSRRILAAGRDLFFT